MEGLLRQQLWAEADGHECASQCQHRYVNLPLIEQAFIFWVM